MLLIVGFAFLSGLATALTPCALPTLPIVLAGAAGGGRRRLAGIAAGFVGTFTLFTLSLTAALRAAGVSPDVLRNLAIGLLAAFGLALVLPRLDARLAGLLAPVQRLGERLPRGGSGLAGGLVVGVALGLVWTPCAGPIFGAVAALAATGDAGPGTFAVLGAYSLGAIIPLLAIGRGGRALVRRLAPRTRAVRPALGVLMLVGSLVLFLGVDTRLTAAALRDLPAYTDALQFFERSAVVESRLAELRPGEPSPLIAAARRTPAPGTGLSGLPDAGPAPELRGISAYFNTDGERVTLESLRGRVVLLDFWTYSCVNCVRTIPFLRELDAAYRDEGLTILGVHTPEFAFEADPGNVADAIDDLGVGWPVVLDPDFATWNAYGNRYWPAKYLIDRDGHVRDLHVGEGGYDETEALVRRALGLPEAGATLPPADQPIGHVRQTHETYLGGLRLRDFATPELLVPNAPAPYRVPDPLPPDRLALDGTWTITGEAAIAGPGAAIELSFRARQVFLVLGGRGARRAGRVLLDGRPVRAEEAGEDVGPGGLLVVEEPRLYRLLDLPGPTRRRTIRVELPPGASGYAFTFGSAA